jgi:hypothetical protein
MRAANRWKDGLQGCPDVEAERRSNVVAGCGSVDNSVALEAG